MSHAIEIGRADAVANVRIRRDGLYVATAATDGMFALSYPMATPASALRDAVGRLSALQSAAVRAIVEHADVGADYDANFVGRIVCAGGAV